MSALAMATRLPVALSAEAALAAIVGESVAVDHLRRLIVRYAPLSVPVLVLGESGTGKELVAAAIHACSLRSRQPLVAVNAATFAPGTVASELFGHARGAFTGAVQGHRGLFEQAHRSTLFLDEVADLALDAQAQLLRVLEVGEVRPVGGETTRKVDVRLVCATHRDLRSMVAKNLFRADLHHRVRVLMIAVPPLRDRQADIPLLAEHLLSRSEQDFGPRRLTPDAIEMLRRYEWPGNVRQLAAVLLRAAVHADRDSIDESTLEGVLTEERMAVQAVGVERIARSVRPESAERIRTALESCGGKIAPAAKMLGIARSTLRARAARYRIAGR